MEKVLITQSTIKSEYGWTQGMIDKLLPEPTLKRNPHYACAAPMKLWPEQVVLEVMESEVYKVAKEKAERRRTGANKAVRTKTDALMSAFEPAFSSIQVTKLHDNEVTERAILSKQAFDDYKAFEGGYINERYAEDAPDNVKERWIVNYIRHNLTCYDKTLYGLGSQIGCNEVYRRYKNAVLDKIAETYPTFSEECKRQKI